MTTLVIIGNGFDIWNGLLTSYWHFHEEYSDSLEEHIQYFDDFCDVDAEWSNFEESLGSFNQDNFHDNAVLQPSLEEMAEDRKLLYGFEDEILNKKDELVDEITKAFHSWISSIDVNMAKKVIEFPECYKFINFNYTTILQDIYLVPESNILHIHGKVKKKLFFGHGLGNDSSGSVSEKTDPWFEQSQRDVSSVRGVFHKPVDEILERNKSQLEGYGDVKEIVVIGHSINDIDMPYFQCILDAYPNAEWQNYNHENLDEGIDEVTETHYKLIRAGVPKDRLTSSSSEALKAIYSVA